MCSDICSYCVRFLYRSKVRWLSNRQELQRLLLFRHEVKTFFSKNNYLLAARFPTAQWSYSSDIFTDIYKTSISMHGINQTVTEITLNSQLSKKSWHCRRGKYENTHLPFSRHSTCSLKKIILNFLKHKTLQGNTGTSNRRRGALDPVGYDKLQIGAEPI